LSRLLLIDPPSDLVVTVAEAKTHLRVDHSDDDTFILALIEAATAYLDGQYGLLQRSLSPQVWELYLDEFPIAYCDSDYPWITIPLPPTRSVDVVAYTDSEGEEQGLVEGTDYEVDLFSTPARIKPLSTGAWPTAKLNTANTVRIRFSSGYEEETSTSGVPMPIKVAIKMMVADMYDNRESITGANVNKVSMPTTVERLLAPYRIHAFA
jgi:uncharacterized phiE125 gp8 family phage protein